MSVLNNFSLLDYLTTCRCYEKENSVIQRTHLSNKVKVQMETYAQHFYNYPQPYFFNMYTPYHRSFSVGCVRVATAHTDTCWSN